MLFPIIYLPKEFLEGDIENGSPFAEFSRKDILPNVWALLDSDGAGAIAKFRAEPPNFIFRPQVPELFFPAPGPIKTSRGRV